MSDRSIEEQELMERRGVQTEIRVNLARLDYFTRDYVDYELPTEDLQALKGALDRLVATYSGRLASR